MASVNNIYMVNVESPFKRYVKTVPSRVGGVRFDSDAKGTVGFILDSDPTGFSYDAEVLEIYSDREDRAFQQYNKSLFAAGLLKEFNQEAPPIDMSNMVSDEEVVEIASIRNLPTLQKRIAEFTSPHTLTRILQAAETIGRPQKTVEAIRQRLHEVGA